MKKTPPTRSTPSKPPGTKKSKGGEKLVTRRELAELLKVHMMTLTKWQDAGMPVAKPGSKGRASFYREVDVRAWLQVREEAAKQPGAVNLVQERARKERAQAALSEQAFQIRMRDLLPRAEVEHAWSQEVAAVRTLLLSWSAALAESVFRAATVEGLPGVQRTLQAAVKDVLGELASPDRPLPETTPPGQAVAAA